MFVQRPFYVSGVCRSVKLRRTVPWDRHQPPEKRSLLPRFKAEAHVFEASSNSKRQIAPLSIAFTELCLNLTALTLTETFLGLTRN